MSFFANFVPLAPLTDEEILGTRVSMKEELNVDDTEESCLEIKEETLDYADELRDEMSDVKELKAPYVTESCGNKCSSDGDQAAQNESLKDKHLKVETTLKRLVCEVCGKKFSRESKIIIHMRVHTKEKPYSCDICNKAFSQKYNLVNHIRVHTKERPYICKICNKAFSQKFNLEKHIRVHTREKPYICEICNKAFAIKGHLVDHIRVHTREKPFICNVCNKGFSKKS